jgi:hypothetical protein
LIKIELSDDIITTLVKDVKLPDESFVTTFGDKIFQTSKIKVFYSITPASSFNNFS